MKTELKHEVCYCERCDVCTDHWHVKKGEDEIMICESCPWVEFLYELLHFLKTTS